MAVGWAGADPAQVVDADNYALGTAYKANEDITITHVRIWAGAGEVNLAGRTGKIWSTGGAPLGTVSLPDDLPTGWSTHALGTPVERLQNQQWVVAYDTGGNYAFLTHALDSDVPSSDGAVTALGFASAPSGINGRFNPTPGDFPASGNASHGFYGADIVYTLGIGGNTAPTITTATVTAAGATATAVINAADAETLVGATYRYDWGDGTTASQTTHPTNSASHTYTASGIYPVLLSVTDADALAAYVARYVEITVPADAMSGVDGGRLLVAVQTQAAKLGAFERLLRHEPKNAPGQGLSYAIWVDKINPVQRRSGLAATSFRFVVQARLYGPMLSEPQDEIDPDITAAVDALMRAYSGAYSLGGIVSEVDLLGAYGDALAARAGYLRQDGKLFRVVDVTIPLIINDAYTQEA